MGRSPWIEKIVGLDKLARIHRTNGKLALSCILIHPLLIALGYAMSAKINFIQQYISLLLEYEDVWQAEVAVILFVITVGTSIYILRKKLKYESWYYVHLFNYLAILLAWGHQLENGADFQINQTFVYYWYALYAFVFGNHLLFRFIRPIYLFHKHQFYVQKIVQEKKNVSSLYISGKQIEKFDVQAGQFMILRFLTKGFWWQAHPFSLSQVSDGKTIRVTIKNVGDFTGDIPHIRPGTKVLIDGPYGVFTEAAAKEKKIVLVAAGIGITPIRSLLEQMVGNKKDIILLYANKRKDEIVFKEEIDTLAKKHKFIVHYFLSQEKVNGYISSRLSVEKIEDLVKDLQKRDIYICGPQLLTDSLRYQLLQKGIKKSLIHYEKFAL
jgi:predicted ferric reductase